MFLKQLLFVVTTMLLQYIYTDGGTPASFWQKFILAKKDIIKISSFSD